MPELMPGHLDGLASAVAQLYLLFEGYRASGSDFCTYCYSKEEIARITSTPVRLLSPEDTRRLMWESSGHWDSADAFRHFLPRVLEAMGPPLRVEDLFPGHLAETLAGLGFRAWPVAEQWAVRAHLDRLEPFLDLADAEDEQDWAAGLAMLGSSSGG
jgi:hypothetical protein